MTDEERVVLCREIEELTKSRAWRHIRASLDASVLNTAHSLGESATMGVDQVHFRRGAIWAFGEMGVLPDRLRQQILNDLAMSQATGASK